MTLKRDLGDQYQEWQEQINSREINMGDEEECRRMRFLYGKDIKDHRYHLEVAILDSSHSEANKQEFRLLIEELEQFQNDLNINFENYREYVDRRYDEITRRIPGTNDEERQGLPVQRIERFEQFQADESFVDDHCVICMADIEVGKNMMRLDCDGKHTFCQVCIEEWFATKKTCPICRHMFQ